MGSFSHEKDVRRGEARIRLAQERVRLTEARIRFRERAFFIEKRNRHYDDLIQNVFKIWSDLSPDQTTQTHEGFLPVHAAIYLNGWSVLKGFGRWSDWALEHVKSGYPELQALFTQLEALERDNNQTASILRENVESEVNHDLRILIDLLIQPYSTGEMQHSVNIDQIFLHIEQGGEDLLRIEAAQAFPPTGYASLVRTYRQRAQVANGNEETIVNLKNEIEKLRVQHAVEHKKLRDNAEEDRKLIIAINAKTQDIIFDIKNLAHLNGRCEFELRETK